MYTLLAQSSVPPPDVIRQTAAEVVSRSYYELGDASRNDGEPLWWTILRWLLKPFIWLFQSMEGWPDFVRWVIVIVCFLLLLALLAHIIYTFVLAIRGPAARRRQSYVLAQTAVDTDELLRDAERAGRAGDYIGAIRLLFRAALSRIEAVEKKKLRPGATNRELLRRYKSTPIFGSLQQFVETIDNKWYGHGTCLEMDYVNCRGEHDRIREYVQQHRPVIGA
jgi:hypothetical protein